MTDGYARALVAFFEVGGMASWAYTVRRGDFTIEQFRQVAPVTTRDRQARQDRRAGLAEEAQHGAAA